MMLRTYAHQLLRPRDGLHGDGQGDGEDFGMVDGNGKKVHSDGILKDLTPYVCESPRCHASVCAAPIYIHYFTL